HADATASPSRRVGSVPPPGARNRMSMIAVTIGIGPVYAEMAERAAERVRAHTGLPTYVLGQAEFERWIPARHIAQWGPLACMALKFHLFDIFPETDDVLYFDADLVFLRPWDPRAFAGSSRFL